MQPIKKIDVHAHCTLYPDIVPKYIGLDYAMPGPDVLMDFYDKLNIERGLLLPIISPEAFYFTMTNENCKTIADAHPDRFFWACNVDPRAITHTNDAQLGYLLEHYKNLGAKSFGELTSNLYADDPMTDNLLGYCAELDLPVTIHIAESNYGYYGIIDELGLPRIRKMLKKHPKLKILGHSMCFWSELGENNDEIRGHFPKGKVRNGAIQEMMYEYENLYCDISANSGANAMMRDREYTAWFLNEFSDRVLYGCDLCRADSRFPFLLDEYLTSMRESGEIKEDTYKKLVRENAINLFKL